MLKLPALAGTQVAVARAHFPIFLSLSSSPLVAEAALLNIKQGFTNLFGTQGRGVLSCRTTDGLVMASNLLHALATFTTMKG
jgi:hypothetical protein